MNTVVAQKIKDFMQQNLPAVFTRNLSLGRIQPPAVGNLVQVIVGVRRCGKTYRLYQEMHAIIAAGYTKQSILYFNFEDERLKPYRKELLEEVIDAFYALNPAAQETGAFMFFDEIQQVPEWGTFLRRMVDTKKATIYVTGSSSKMLSSQLASEFRGRSLSHELFPLSFSEYVRYHGLFSEGQVPSSADVLSSAERYTLIAALGKYLVTGGFIPVQQLTNAEAIQLLQEFALHTVNLDVVERYGIHNPSVAAQFISRCIASSARELSINKVHNAFKSAGVGIARETLSRLLTYYEEAYLVFAIRNFSQSLAENPRAVSKLYAVDPGMLVAFSSAIANDEAQRLETAVFNKLRRTMASNRSGSLARLLVKNASGSYEVDFVMGDALFQEAYELIQVAVSVQNAATRKREVRALREAMRQYHIGSATIITSNEEEEISVEEGFIQVVPAWRWLLD